MGTASADISEMEQAALHRISKSIAQLTLCQVTGEEIETATELLEKACQKLGAFQKFLPSGSLTLTTGPYFRGCPSRALELSSIAEDRQSARERTLSGL